jgi:uncharacterized protein YjbJ (UPF0337 family)
LFDDGSSTTFEGFVMNKDQVKGRVKEAAGETQEHLGRLVGSKEQEAKGHAREMAGKVQKNVGDAREAVKDVAKDAKDAFKKP